MNATEAIEQIKKDETSAPRIRAKLQEYVERRKLSPGEYMLALRITWTWMTNAEKQQEKENG